MRIIISASAKMLRNACIKLIANMIKGQFYLPFYSTMIEENLMLGDDSIG